MTPLFMSKHTAKEHPRCSQGQRVQAVLLVSHLPQKQPSAHGSENTEAVATVINEHIRTMFGLSVSVSQKRLAPCSPSLSLPPPPHTHTHTHTRDMRAEGQLLHVQWCWHDPRTTIGQGVASSKVNVAVRICINTSFLGRIFRGFFPTLPIKE